MVYKLQLENGKIVDLWLLKGQKKCVVFLLVLVEFWDIILLDEWVVDQDLYFCCEFYQVLLLLMQQMGKIVFVISYDDYYFQYVDCLLEMCVGQFVEFIGEEWEQVFCDVVVCMV